MPWSAASVCVRASCCDSSRTRRRSVGTQDAATTQQNACSTAARHALRPWITHTQGVHAAQPRHLAHKRRPLQVRVRLRGGPARQAADTAAAPAASQNVRRGRQQHSDRDGHTPAAMVAGSKKLQLHHGASRRRARLRAGLCMRFLTQPLCRHQHCAPLCRDAVHAGQRWRSQHELTASPTRAGNTPTHPAAFRDRSCSTVVLCESKLLQTQQPRSQTRPHHARGVPSAHTQRPCARRHACPAARCDTHAARARRQVARALAALRPPRA